MRAEELLMNNMKCNLPYVSTYDKRYVDVDLHVLEENCGHDACICYELATRYRSGIGGAQKSPEKSYEYYKKVLYTQRNVRAMYWLGYLSLFFIPGMEQDGMLYLKTAESLGDKDSAWLLGCVFFEMPNIAPTDKEKAYALFLNAKDGTSIKTIDRYLGRCAESLNRIDEARKHYFNGLDQGDKACANYLGYMYYAGDGVEQNFDYAKKFFDIGVESTEENQISYAKMMISMIALNNGMPKEKFNGYVYLKYHSTTNMVNLAMGKTLLEGIPGYLGKNEDEALKYFEMVPDYDRGEAFYYMAWIHYSRMNREKGDRYILDSANRGYAPAIAMVMGSDKLMLMHIRESFDEIITVYNDKYDKASIQTVRKDAETDPVAMYELGSRYRMGQDGVEKNLEEAAKWYRKVLWYQRNANAMYHLGTYNYEDKENDDIGMAYWQFSYSYGNEDAAIKIGIYYEYGDEQMKPDLDKALQFYQFAKEHGRKDTDLFIGSLYCRMGKYDLGETYLRNGLISNPDNSYAYADMGYFYLDVKNPKYDEAAGIRWFKEAAKRGNKDAQEVLNEIEQQKKEEERQKKTSAEQLLREDDQIQASGENNEQKLFNRWKLLTFAEKNYPNHPEILKRFIDVSNMVNYLIKFTKKNEKDAEKAYLGFRMIDEKITHLRNLTGWNSFIQEARSFTAAHLAELALSKNEDSYAKTLLESADRELTPVSAVIAVMYYMKQDEKLESNVKMSDWDKNKLRQSYHQNIKNELSILSKTVDTDKNWTNLNQEKAVAYYTLAMCYGTKQYEPFIHYDPTLAKKYWDKCGKLNPSLIK